MTRQRRSTGAVAIATAGAVAVAAYATVAILQILLWNPLAAAPGLSLTEIHDEMAAAGERVFAPGVIGFLLVGPLLAVFLLIAARRPDTTRSATAIGYLGVLAGGAVAYFLASFGPGMALADTFLISGADAAPAGWILLGVSAASVIALVAVVVSVALHGRARPGTALST
ncbi:hypothetical protein ABXJ56_13845 [Microbacterium chocolatum]|uniref:hypothetical protein n=1 Tax=Microbacterium aurantiacum TaxID=162393 RepID=UPI00338F1816